MSQILDLLKISHKSRLGNDVAITIQFGIIHKPVKSTRQWEYQLNIIASGLELTAD